MPLGRNQGGGAGRRPAPGDIRPKGIRTRSPANLQALFLIVRRPPPESTRKMRPAPLALQHRESGGTGRRPGFRCRCRKAWGFESPLSHHPTSRLNAAQSRSEEHTSELQSLMRISYAVFCLKKKKKRSTISTTVPYEPRKRNIFK